MLVTISARKSRVHEAIFKGNKYRGEFSVNDSSRFNLSVTLSEKLNHSSLAANDTVCQ